MQDNFILKAYKHPATRLAMLMCIIAVPMFAQSPFVAPVTAIQTFLTGTFARIAASIAIIIGGWELVGGSGHGHSKIAGIAVAVGMMVEAVQIVNWLYA